MVSCKLQGGLGNQIFQIAAAYALALKNNDISGFDFNGCYTPLQGYSANKYVNNILSKVNSSNGHVFRYVYNEPKHSYEELPYTKDLLLQGYFQSEKYFNGYKKEIIELFKTDTNKDKIDKLLSQYNNKPVTSIHVRRGDYINLPDFHPVCSMEYYKKAMAEIGDSTFVLISDDIEWVKENFKGDNIVYSSFNDEIDELTLMVSCDNNIIANSSFSWWGAYFNPNENKKIIAPNNWFGPKGPQDTNDIIPSNWIKI